MVWGLYPVDPLPGEESYYLFSRGTYKVGRKGCDIIVNKDKGVSRVHAELVIDVMVFMDNTKKKSSEMRIRDCSKYGTFVKKSVGSKEKVHEFPNKEATLDDSDLVSFGTGNATYRVSFIPFVFYMCGLELARSKEFEEMISLIGASVSNKWSPQCTHVLVDNNASLNADLVDAILSKRHFVSYTWIKLLADKRIGTEIPSYSSYVPTLTLEGDPVKVADPESRENCLSGYRFLMESSDKYKAKKLQSLLEAFGAKVVPVGDFIPHSQGLEDDESNKIVHVISENNSEYSHDLAFVPKVSEINLIRATLSGHLDPAVFVSPPVLVTSSCSTDETVVADSEPEVEIMSVHTSPTICKVETVQHDYKLETASNSTSPKKSDDRRNTTTYGFSAKPKDSPKNDGISMREHKIDDDYDTQLGTSDVIFSQDLIIRDSNVSVPTPTNNEVLNFKRFKKMETESGNGFYNLVPFSKHPYKGSEYDNEEVAESLKEEKKRKQREAIADDLFNKTKDEKKDPDRPELDSDLAGWRIVTEFGGSWEFVNVNGLKLPLVNHV
ncbi:nibrin homolog [Rutidosis leptorrhynchoides]|uniref:nibrin homolog n=1 Tax=Rutidosis leptorrhynchoides TaxID=125765 RepID=UPI003A99DFE5